MRKVQRVIVILFTVFICVNAWRAGHQSLIEGDRSVAALMFFVGCLALYVPLTIMDIKENNKN
tara:strand:+ start:905 stop:1093 length:189 start_codon:yes stop_codon:yes gene_type:complete